MADPLVDAQITAQERLRAIVDRAVTVAWQRLPEYDERNVPEWLAAVVPLILAAQRQSVAVTAAYVARATRSAPLGLSVADLIGPAVRAGVPADEQWRRPFVTVWSGLSDGVPWEDAVAHGLARARSMAVTDVQLAHRATLAAAQDREPQIRGYRRVPDGGACSFCQRVAGAFVRSASALPLHPGCGCGFQPVMSDEDLTPLPDTVAVHEHGELGPVLGSSSHDFTRL